MAGKKNPREWGSIRKQPTKSARFQASYVGPDQRRHFAEITFDSKMAAERWLGKERELIEKAAASDAGLASWKPPEARRAENKETAVTLAEYGAADIAQRDLAPRTRIGYEDSFRLYIKPKLGRYAVRDLNPPLIREWYAGLGTNYATRNKHAYDLLRSICSTAVKDSLLQSNPCQIDRASSAKPKRKKVVLTVEQVEAIADQIGSDPKTSRFRALVLLSAWCGLRWSEVSELRRSDFDDDCAVVSITRDVTHRKGCHTGPPKADSSGDVVIPPDLVPDIKAHLANHVDKPADSPLFVAARGGCHVNDRVFGKDVLKPACDALGLKDVTHHDLRHFAGTMTAQVGNLVETMARLRHSTAKASLIYQHQVSGRDVAIAEALSALRAETAAERTKASA